MKTIIKEVQCGTIMKFTFYPNKKDKDIETIIKQIRKEEPSICDDGLNNKSFSFNYKVYNIEVFKNPNSRNDIFKLGSVAIEKMNEIIKKTESKIEYMKIQDWDWQNEKLWQNKVIQ